MIRRRHFFATAALAASLVLAAPAGSAAQERPSGPPSLLLITLDTTRADRLGCYGAADAATPHLDALAASGARFERALAPTPLTLPSHATLMTARVPRRHGVRDNGSFVLGDGPPVLAEVLRAAGYRTAAFVSSAVLDRRARLDRGFEHYDDRVRVGNRRAFNYEERAASQTNRAVLEHLPALEPPFFLWVHYFDPHLPYVPPEPYRSRFAGRPYDGEIAFMDEQLGALLAAVRRRAGRLLVAVAGDHGESLGEHGEDAHGVFLYQSTQHVPLILSGPGVPAGRVVRGNAGLVDLAPTLLELLGLEPLRDADGASLVPRLKEGSGTAGADTTRYEMETFFPRFAYGWSPLRALVRGRWKYVEAPEAELYDLDADPGERNNLARDRGRAAARLARDLAARVGDDDPWIAGTGEDPEMREHRRRLESLGYVGGTPSAPGAPEPDPKRMIALVRELDTARRELAGGSPREAALRLERLLERSPRTLPAWLVLARCRLALGDPTGAAATARRAIALSPEDELAWFNLANALGEAAGDDDDRVGEARSAYERALELHPRFADAYLNYAALLARTGRLAESRELLARAVAAKVEDPDVYLELGLLELARGETAAAAAALERAIALHDCAAEAHEALGRIAFASERSAEAAAHYEQALRCAPSAATAKTLGSIYLYRLDDPEGARRAWRRALELLAPDDPDAKTLRELLSTLK